MQIPKGTKEDRAKEVAHKDDLESARRTILSMTEFMEVRGCMMSSPGLCFLHSRMRVQEMRVRNPSTFGFRYCFLPPQGHRRLSEVPPAEIGSASEDSGKIDRACISRHERPASDPPPSGPQESNARRTVRYAMLEWLALACVVGVQVFFITKFFESGRVKIISV